MILKGKHMFFSSILSDIYAVANTTRMQGDVVFSNREYRLTPQKHVNLCHLNNESCQNTKSIPVLINDNRCDLKCHSLEVPEGLL